MAEDHPLKEKILEIIKQNGNISFYNFMEILLNDNLEGYYIKNNPFGEKGDFITSPEISQVFGELIGIWIGYIWLLMNAPKKITLVELGAGKGTLLKDILRSTKNIPNFHKALEIQIVEINDTLQEIQEDNLIEYDNILWIKSVEDINTKNPLIIYSNEFFDALPVRQYTFKNNCWHEVLLKLNEKNELEVALAKDIFPINFSQELKRKALQGDIYETSPKANYIFNHLCNLIKENKGAILTIDYGNALPNFKNSIRGFKNHQVLNFQEILKNYINTDITYNINFFELYKIAKANNLTLNDIITQKEFLESLGLHERKDALLSIIENEEDKKLFISSVEKLIQKADMGEIYKVFITSYGI